MALTTHVGARRAGSLVAALGVVLAMLFVASPAQAAPVVNLSVNDTTITLGESVTLTWTAADSTSLTAEGDWTGAKALPNGSEEVTPTEAGTFTYTLVAGNDSDPDSSDSVEVTVAPGPITPAPVTFPDPCTVVVPSTENVTYFVDYGDEDIEELDADTYDGTDFSDPESPVLFYAEADPGFTLAEGAVSSWEYTAPEDCFGMNATLVKVDATCGEVTFENISDGTVTVLYGAEGEDEPDGDFTLGAGKTRTVKTDRVEVLFIAFTDDDGEVQFDTVEVPQDCDSGSGSGGGSDHPTVAPAAGLAAR